MSYSVNLNAFKKDTLTEKLYYEKAESIFNQKSPQYNVVSIQFAVHYLFKNHVDLKNFVENIDENLKLGGIFMGTCFDGSLIWEKLKDLEKGDLISGSDKNGKLLWKIIKKYTNLTNSGKPEFPENNLSLDHVISVFISSINALINEYLVEFEYFKK